MDFSCCWDESFGALLGCIFFKFISFNCYVIIVNVQKIKYELKINTYVNYKEIRYFFFFSEILSKKIIKIRKNIHTY